MTGSLGTVLVILDRKQEAGATRIEARVEARLDEQNKRFDRIDDRFDRVDDRFNRVDERFDRMDAEIKYNRVSLVRIQSTLDYMIYGPGDLPILVARAREGFRADDSEDAEQGNRA